MFKVMQVFLVSAAHNNSRPYSPTVAAVKLTRWAAVPQAGQRVCLRVPHETPRQLTVQARHGPYTSTLLPATATQTFQPLSEAATP